MTYEYVCQACGHQWEAQQPISADPLKDCPRCGEAQAKRQISRGGGFILKGGGWYSDLYSSPASASTAAGAESKTPAESGSNVKSAEATSTGSSDSASTPAAAAKAAD